MPVVSVTQHPEGRAPPAEDGVVFGGCRGGALS